MNKVSISDLIKKTKQVPVAVNEDGTECVDVKGLSIRDIGSLCHEHKDILKKLISPETKTEEKGIDWGKLIDISPAFCAEVISKGAGCSADDAADLPTGIQVRLLIGIWGASAIDAEIVEGAVKKIVDLLTKVNNTIGLSN